MKQLLIAGIIVGILIAIGIFIDIPNKDVDNITSFEECAKKHAVMESYPRQCRTAGNVLFIEDIGNEVEKIDIIRLNTPRPNQIVTSPLVVTGEARGTWFFEGNFPIRLLNEEGDEMAVTFATAQGEWMVEGFVPFTATVEFSVEDNERGSLILEKDNPSGLPEHDDVLHLPVRF